MLLQGGDDRSTAVTTVRATLQQPGDTGVEEGALIPTMYPALSMSIHPATIATGCMIWQGA